MIGVFFRRFGFADVTVEALLIVEGAHERHAIDIAVGLGMRIVAIDAGHGAVEIAIAGNVIELVSECTDAAIVEIRTLRQNGQFERIMFFERFARQERRIDCVFNSMALEANVERFVFGQRFQGRQANIFCREAVGRFHDFDVPPSRTMTGFTIDCQFRVPGFIGFLHGIVIEQDLAAVTILAIGVIFVGA